MIENLAQLIQDSFDKNADRTAIRVLRQLDQQYERSLRYVPMTYRQLQEQRDRLIVGLSAVGLKKGSRVAVLTDGGLEPILVFLACDVLGLSTAPLCNKLPDDILTSNLRTANPALLFCDPKSWDQVQRIRPKLPNELITVLTKGKEEGARTFSDLIKQSGEAPKVDIDPEDEAKVLFTSGSSGLPKGVVQTHRNVLDNILCVWGKISVREDMVFFKSAPDYHTMGILNIYYPLARGWSLDLARSPDHVLSDIRYSRPQALLTVPLVLDKVYGNVRKAIASGGMRGKLISRSLQAKQKLSRGQGSPIDWFVHAAIGKKIVAKIKNALAARLGDRLELLMVGSAKADPEALDFFQEVLGIASFEGYGVTECAPLVAANTIAEQKTGTVGKVLQEVKLMTEDGVQIGYGNPFMNTYLSSNGQAGELWVHGTHVMRGYLGDPTLSAEVLVTDEEGKVWFQTGDLFEIDDEGFITFRGRVGRQFKLRNGEFVNPERLERLFSAIQLIEHVVVYGDQSRDFPLPLVTVNLDEVRGLKEITDVPVNDEDALRNHPAVAKRIREELLDFATEHGLPAHERPQRIVVLPESLSEGAGTLTRGLKKLVPKRVAEIYQAEIESAYRG